MRAAAFYRVPPWKLLDKPLAWVVMANQLMAADEHAAQMRRRSSQTPGPWL